MPLRTGAERSKPGGVVIRWSAALTTAGITDPRLRRTYDTQRGFVRRFALHEHVAVRLLLPTHLHPPVIAAVAYMHATDELIDASEAGARQAALRSWDAETTAALECSEPPARGTLAALWDTTRRHPHLATRVRALLDGAPVEAGWTGFDTEADFQAYVDSYSLPGLMLTASLIAPVPDAGADEPFVKGCRALIEGGGSAATCSAGPRPACRAGSAPPAECRCGPARRPRPGRGVSRRRVCPRWSA
ncbi:squalene/phytoene synthase family protein [Streptomyces europaeiscabiei]|uniref:squalene/phytoene synthase family protein n=1 Tax=Streptomyces europaeiscabiei TaxID=146819 RepID=UPI002E1053B7|nr:squalene/phytoene synthase family protein [Streptomyces europaeiscabiei]